MLVVIALIAILAAILFPVFATARKSARRSKCMHQQGLLLQALKVYQEDFRYYPPPPGFTGSRYLGGFSALYPNYVSDYAAMLCPCDFAVISHQEQAKQLGYCSYNGRIVGQFNSSSANFWAFMPIANDGYSPGNEGAAGSELVPKMRTYNWGGFNDYGYDISYYTNPGWYYFINPMDDPKPGYVSSWRKYPRLNNNKAPDSTIVARCVLHEPDYGNGLGRDLIVRVGGRVENIDVSGMSHRISPYNASEWRMQR